MNGYKRNTHKHSLTANKKEGKGGKIKMKEKKENLR